MYKTIRIQIIFVIFTLFLFISFTNVSATDEYTIELAHDDELFVINGEKFEAQTWCLFWEEGDKVIFLEGSPHGICLSTVLYNVNKSDKCEVWCE